MQKRKLIIGTYDTAAEGLWTLSAWSLSRAEAHESYIDVPGHSGALDLSTALTDGEPYYGNRELDVVLESSEGTRQEREQRINRMINKLDGFRFNITLPDDTMHYITGRVRVEKLYNDMVHASVRIKAICDPWRYNNTETVVGLVATAKEQTAPLINGGRRSVVPAITVTGGDVIIKFTSGEQESSWALSPREYRPEELPTIYLKTGTSILTYSGAGQIVLTYREAVL